MVDEKENWLVAERVRRLAGVQKKRPMGDFSNAAFQVKNGSDGIRCNTYTRRINLVVPAQPHGRKRRKLFSYLRQPCPPRAPPYCPGPSMGIVKGDPQGEFLFKVPSS